MKITMTHEGLEALQGMFKGTSLATLYKALSYSSNSELASRVRCYAVNHLGGKRFVINN